MLSDIYGGHHSTNNLAAVTAFEAATRAVAAHAPAAAALEQTLALAPDFVAAHALRGLGNVILARAETVETARIGVTRTRAALAVHGGGTAGERALADAHELAALGRSRAAAARLEAHVVSHPRDLLALKVAHALRFMAGEPRSMLAITSSAVDKWPSDAPGLGYLLGCHAFALEETGAYAAAETAGRRAVELQPDDVWALHAVAHVMEMGGRTADGIAWLDASRQTWPHCGSFGLHMAWHLALFHLAAGERERALALYDENVVPGSSCDFRDLANAASFLWRMEQHGANVGARWDAIADIAENRRRDTTYVFASLHHLLALTAAGRTSAAHDVVEALETKALDTATDQGAVAREVGAELARALVSLAPCGRGFTALAANQGLLGGSNAQRDVFVRTLMRQAAEAGDRDVFASLASIRLRLRREDEFQRSLRVKLNGRAMKQSTPDAGKIRSAQLQMSAA